MHINIFIHTHSASIIWGIDKTVKLGRHNLSVILPNGNTGELKLGVEK
jgi:hypothetical protein